MSRKIDIVNLQLRNPKPLGKTSIKTLIKFFNQRLTKNYSRISQFKNTNQMKGLKSLQIQYILASSYNKIIENNRKEAQAHKKASQSLATKLNRKYTNGFKKFHETGFIELPLDVRVVPLKKLIEKIIKESHNKMVIIQVGDYHYTINDRTRLRLQEFIENNLVQREETTESDGEIFIHLNQAETFSLKIVERVHKNQNHNGAFFKYMNKTDIDLTRQGIFNTFEPKNYIDNCLVYALQQAGVAEEKLDKIRLIVKNRNIPLKDFKQICETIEICLVVKKIDKEEHVERNAYGKQFEEKYYIGLIDNHFFLIEPTNYTSYVVKNYWNVKDQPNYNNIISYDIKKEKFMRLNSRYIDSYDAVKIMFENKETHLEEIQYENSTIASTQFYDKIDGKITSLEYTNAEARLVIDEEKEKPESSKKIIYQNVFFDFETYVLNKEGKDVHIPYLCCMIDETGKKRTFYGENCGQKMLYSLTSNTRLIAHNATYDYRFIINYLHQINEIGRGTKMISCKGKFGNYNIIVKDSLQLISMPLKDFPKTFNIESLKEVMPYNLYNKNTVEEKFVDIEYAKTFVSQSDLQQFLQNIEKWNLYDETKTKYDIIEYSKRYCELDCYILQKGYNTFRQWMQECVDIDINDTLTLASLADKYLKNQGCYDGVYQLSGIPQMFIQKCAVGGRTMVANNQKCCIIKNIQDFDAVSLYPSAMERMEGFLKGKPKLITNFEEIKNTADGYFVEIKITKLKKILNFPLLSYINENGVRNFTNDMVGKTVFVDKVSLEDAIEFQQIEYEFIRGYYFNDGFNSKIKTTIRYLFNMRLQKKKEKNKCEMVYKLIMNSGYGRMIMKAVETETRIFDNQHDFQVYLSRNYNWVKCFTLIEGGEKIKVESMKSIIEHFNTPQLGVMVLSWSKRIMNEVMTLADSNKINIYYQDTDSMHIDEDQIELLSDLFKEKYGRELIGTDMGQFHSDFDFANHSDVKAVRSIFLGKKSYIDELQGINDDTGNIDTTYHIRMKGIPNSVLLYTSEKLGYKNPFEMYKDLYAGKKINFDLTNDGTKVNFKFNKNYQVHTLSVFNRELQF